MRNGHATIDLRDDSSRLVSLPFQTPGRQIVRVDKVSLVIPTLNEGRNIGFVLEHVPDRVDEIIIVDGHSTDDTIAAARAVRPDVVIVQQVGAGKGSALRAGFAAATGDIIVMMDADGSMDPAEILSYVYAIEAGYEFVKGSRAIKGGGSEDLTLIRRFGNFALTSAVNVLFLVPFSDLCYGFVGFRKDRLDDLALMSRGFEFETEIAIRAIKVGLRIAEVPEQRKQSTLWNVQPERLPRWQARAAHDHPGASGQPSPPGRRLLSSGGLRAQRQGHRRKPSGHACTRGPGTSGSHRCAGADPCAGATAIHVQPSTFPGGNDAAPNFERHGHHLRLHRTPVGRHRRRHRVPAGADRAAGPDPRRRRPQRHAARPAHAPRSRPEDRRLFRCSRARGCPQHRGGARHR